MKTKRWRQFRHQWWYGVTLLLGTVLPYALCRLLPALSGRGVSVENANRLDRPPRTIPWMDKLTRPFLPSFLMVAFTFAGCSDKSFRQSGSSAMSPTIQPNELVTADMSAYRKSGPSRWDVIVFHPTPAPTARRGEMWVMRVIGLPGEALEIRDDGIYINGQRQSPTQHLAGIHYRGSIGTPPSNSYPFRVPADAYFVVGDNTKNSFDSRFWGALPKTDILGKVKNK